MPRNDAEYQRRRVERNELVRDLLAKFDATRPNTGQPVEAIPTPVVPDLCCDRMKNMIENDLRIIECERVPHWHSPEEGFEIQLKNNLVYTLTRQAGPYNEEWTEYFPIEFCPFCGKGLNEPD